MSDVKPSCVALFRQRALAVPEHFEAVAQTRWPDDAWLKGVKRVGVAGVGMAEGPARFLVSLWSQALGLPTRYLAATHFLEAEQVALPDEALIIFSQGLSPNARQMMAHAGAFKRALLITSSGDDEACPYASAWRASGAATLKLPPFDAEDKLLIRILGPALAQLAMMRWTMQLQPALQPAWSARLAPQALAQSYARAFESGQALGEGFALERLGQPLTLLTLGQQLELSHGLRWKCLESLWCAVPAAVDLLGFAHGPLQGLYAKEAWFIALHRGTPKHQALIARLRRVMPAHHALVELRAEASDWPLACLDYEAQLNGFLAAVLARRGVPLLPWPGHGQDGALYELDERGL